jgi:hypothetical protein
MSGFRSTSNVRFYFCFWPVGSLPSGLRQRSVSAHPCATGQRRRARGHEPSGWFFHGLKGVDRYSVRVTGNWRVTFGWLGEDAMDVDIEDYH